MFFSLSSLSVYSNVENRSVQKQEEEEEEEEEEEVYLFISLAHFGLHVVPLFIHSVNNARQLFTGVLKQERQRWCQHTDPNHSLMDIMTFSCRQ